MPFERINWGVCQKFPWWHSWMSHDVMCDGVMVLRWRHTLLAWQHLPSATSLSWSGPGKLTLFSSAWLRMLWALPALGGSIWPWLDPPVTVTCSCRAVASSGASDSRRVSICIRQNMLHYLWPLSHACTKSLGAIATFQKLMNTPQTFHGHLWNR